MFIALAIITFAICIMISWLLQRAEQPQQAAATSPALAAAGQAPVPPDSLMFHPGHSWLQRRDDGLVDVGCDDFSSRFLGQLAQVIMPKVGTIVNQGEAAWTLVSKRGRRLTQVAPASGEVVKVNLDLLKDPAALQRSPYRLGWILQLRPTQLKQALANLVPTCLAEAWQEAVKARLTSRLSNELGSTAADGGQWAPDLGDQLDDQTWEDLRRDLYPPADDQTS